MKKDKRVHDKFDGIMFFSAELVGLILLVIFYPFVTVTSEMITNKLIIDVPKAATAGDTIKIKVTAGDYQVEDVSISIDPEIGLIDNRTNINGILEYTLPRTLKGVYNITAAKLGYEKATKSIEIQEHNKLEIQCLHGKSLITPKIEPRNIIIIIDASGSTLGVNTEPIVNETGYMIAIRETFSFIDLIKTNAINIVQNTHPLKNEYGHTIQDSYIGVVVFGSGSVSKTEMLSMESENNKSELENFIRGISPKGTDYPADIDINNGLKMTNEMMDNITGTKEIIILSDGIYNKDLGPITNTLVDLKNKKNINIYFVQVLVSTEKDRNAIRPYAELAKAVNSQVIVLNPEERIGSFINITIPKIVEEKCLTRTNDTTQIIVISNLPIEGAEISYENNIIGITNKSGMLNYIFANSGLFNLTATKSGYESTIKIIEILPNQTSIQTVNPEPTYTKIITSEHTTNNKVSGFEIIFGILMILIIYIRKK